MNYMTHRPADLVHIKVVAAGTVPSKLDYGVTTAMAEG